MTSYKSLLSPITIKGRTFKNRVFSSAHAPGYAENGLPGERYQAYHEEKARGGIGLTMFGGSSIVSRDSGAYYGQLFVGDDRVIKPFQELAHRVRRHDAGLMCQITHMGRRTSWDFGDWMPTKGPSARRDPAHHSAPYELSTREIARIVRDYAAAARRCREGDLDGIELLGSAHLIGQFLSPLANVRRDSYGGCLKNRTRFLFEVLEACREAVGDDFLISIRTNADESNEGGLTPEEGIEIARLIGTHGVADIINVNGAYGGTDMGMAEYMPGMAFKAAPFVELASRVRAASGLATFQAARLSDPSTAEWAIAEGHLDMAGMTRPHMADPEIVAKLERGEDDRIRPCVGAGYCLDRVYIGRDSLCQHNVSTGREAWLSPRIEPAELTRRAVVVGGGPGGMEAARVLALRGHEVTLFEAGARLGGQILLAAKGGWRKDMIGIADWLATELELLGVSIQLNIYAEADDVLPFKPDVVIVATGGLPSTELPDGGNDAVVSVWDALSGHESPSGRVLIFDSIGGHAALSLADKLTDTVSKLTFVTSDRLIGRAIGVQNVPVYLRNLTRAGVRILPDRALNDVRVDGNERVALVRHTFTREIEELRGDTIVADLGIDPLTEVFDALVERSVNFGELDYEALADLRPQHAGANPDGGFQLFRIGDVLAPRDMHAAMFDANRLCRVL